MAISLGGIASAVRKRFYDTFTRSNTTGGLGTATDGSLWNAVRGTFTVVSNKATGDTSNYPIATQKMPTSDINLSISSASQGAAAALWVTDSGNWWAVGIDQTTTSCNCQTCSQCNAYSGGNCASSTGGNCATSSGGNCSSWNAVTCNSWNTGTCNAWNTGNCAAFYCNVWSGSYCVSPPGTGCLRWNATSCRTWSGNTCAVSSGGNCASWNAVVCNSWNAVVCNAWNAINCTNTTYYSCNCQTCYPQWVRVMKSVSTVVSEVTNWSIGSVIQSLRVKTTGTQITTQVYSDTALTTQIGSDLVYSATGATVAAEYGITIKPSSANQAYTLGTVDITRN